MYFLKSATIFLMVFLWEQRVVCGWLANDKHDNDQVERKIDNTDFSIATIARNNYYSDLIPVLRDHNEARMLTTNSNDESRWWLGTTPAYLNKFLPEVSRQHYRTIKACSSIPVLLLNNKHYECPSRCDIFQCFHTFKLYRHDPCSCQGYRVCEYDSKTRKLKKTTTSSCQNYQPYYSTKNFCIDKEKFYKFYKSTHPYLGHVCDYQYFLYLTFHDDGSGSPMDDN
jgi:hypothetical protein